MEIRIAEKEEIMSSRNKWNSIVKSMQSPTIFLTWEWIITWLNHFGKYYEPIILFIYDEAELAAIFPLARRSIRLPGGFLKLKTISICGSMELYPNHLDIICKEGKAVLYIRKAFEFLASEYTDWDVLHLAFLSEKGYLSSYLRSPCNNEEHKIQLVCTTVSPYISTKGDLKTYLNNFSGKKRYNLNREKKNLFQAHNVTFQCVETIEDLNQGLNDLFRLHKKRAEDKRIKSTFDGVEILDFHREIARIFFNMGWLRLYVLKKDNNIISSAYGFLFENKFNFYQTGLEPEWKQFSAGKILIYKIIENLFIEDASEFDFLGGDEDYKTFWIREFRSNFTYNVFNRAGMTVTAEKLLINTKGLAKSILEKHLVRVLT